MTWVNSSFNSAIEELLSSLLVLRSCVADISLEEFLLSMSEVWVGLYLAWDVLEWILNATLLSASLVKLVVAELVHFRVIIDAVEVSIRLDHCFLLVLRQVWKSTFLSSLVVLQAHLGCSRLGKS